MIGSGVDHRHVGTSSGRCRTSESLGRGAMSIGQTASSNVCGELQEVE